MWASLIIFECWLACSSEYHEAFKTAQSQAERVCLVHQEAFLSNQYFWSHCRGIVVSMQTLLLSKQVRTIVTGRQCDAQMIEFPGAYTLLGKHMVIAEHSKAEQGLVIVTYARWWRRVVVLGCSLGPEIVKCMSWFWPPGAPRKFGTRDLHLLLAVNKYVTRYF